MLNDIKITINEAIVFSLLEKFGNTYEVSKNLNLGTAAINASINNLEKKLGKTLFTRNRRTGSFALTNEGKHLRSYVKSLIESAQAISSGPRADDNSIIMSSTHGILMHILSPYFDVLRESFPELKLGFRQDDSLEFKNKNWNEIIITSFMEDVSEYEYIPYHNFQQKLWASEKYILKYGSPTSIEELVTHRLLTRKEVDEPKALFGSAYIRSQISDTSNLKIIDVHGSILIDHLCEQGWGIMAGAEETIKLGNINVHNVYPDFEGDSIQIFVCVSKEFLKTKTAKKVINWIFESRNKALWKVGIKPSYPFGPYKI